MKQSLESSTHTNTNLTKSRGIITCEWYNTPIVDRNNQLLGYVSMAHDITDREIIKASLKELEEMFRNMSEQSLLGMYLTKGNSIVFTNEGFAKIVGHSAGEIANWDVTQKLREMIHPGDIAKVLEQRNLEMHGKMARPYAEYRIIRADRKVRWIQHYSKPIESESGVLIQGILLDITDQKEISLVLQESEQKFRTFADQSFIGINVTQDGHTKYSNQATELITGYTQEERNSWSEDENLQLILEDDRDYVVNLFADDQQSQEDNLLEYTYRIKTKDGQIKWVEDNSKMITFKDKLAWLSFLLDVTEKRRMEEEIMKSSKLESLGVLAGGIAHDFNNLLTSIIGNLSIASLEIDENQISLRELMSETENACIRAAQLTKQLLTFSKGGAPIKQSTSIIHILTDTAQLHFRGPNTQFISDVVGDLADAQVDIGQFSQVVQNIVINAKQAMPHGGKIRISATNFEPSAKIFAAGLRENKNYVRITISDTGIGIPGEFYRKYSIHILRQKRAVRD